MKREMKREMREKHLERGSEGEGWQEVVRRKKKRSVGGMGRLDVVTSSWKPSLEGTISFYFSDFPETHGAREMLRAFKFYGEAMEVVIPPKRDRWGKRFGFVRFKNVEDPRIFAIKLDNIIFGSKKIHVNVPRFQREWIDGTSANESKNRAYVGKYEAGRGRKQQQQNPFHAQQQVQEGNGFVNRQAPRIVQKVWRKKEVDVEEDQEVERQVQKIVYHRKNNTAEVCYNVPEEEMKKFKKMYVGTVRTPGTTYSVQEWFSMQGFFSIKITPLGANKVLMEEWRRGLSRL